MFRDLLFFQCWFQHTAARRRLHFVCADCVNASVVSTHSRAEAAAVLPLLSLCPITVSTHSRAEAAACNL